MPTESTAVTDTDREHQIATLIRQKLRKLDSVINMLISRGRSTTDAEREYTRCIAWAHALNAGTVPQSTWPNQAEDGRLLLAMHKVDVYAATSGSINDLLSASNGLIAAYKAP